MVQHTHKKLPKDINVKSRKEEKRYYNEKLSKEIEEEVQEELESDLAEFKEGNTIDGI